MIVREAKAAVGVEARVNVGSWTQFGVLLIEKIMSCGYGSTPTSSDVLAGGFVVKARVVTVQVMVITKFFVTVATIG